LNPFNPFLQSKGTEMKKPNIFTLSGAIFALCMAVIPVAHAQQGSIELKNIAEIEIETKDAQGKVERKRAAVSKAIPGTEVIYTTTFKNVGSKPAGNIVINNPVPANTTLVSGSVIGANADITYSVDGNTFATPDKLKVKGKDGKDVTATTADYTAIRWTYKGDLAAGKTGEAGFRAVIK
jgi:uncharacterized repeat protein (TIGR01451 family)